MRYVPAAVLYIHFRTLQHVEWTASDTNHAPYVSMSRTFWCDYAFLLEENNIFSLPGGCVIHIFLMDSTNPSQLQTYIRLQ